MTDRSDSIGGEPMKVMVYLGLPWLTDPDRSLRLRYWHCVENPLLYGERDGGTRQLVHGLHVLPRAAIGHVHAG